MAKSIPELSHDTRVVAAKLVDAFVRNQRTEPMPYDEIMPGIRQRRHILASAMRIVEREHNVLLACVPNVGVKRLTADKISTVPEDAAGAIHRKAHRARTRTIRAMESETLTNEQRVELFGRIAILGATEQVTSTAASKKLLQSMNGQAALPSIDETLKRLRG